MATQTEVTKALEKIARGHTLDAGDQELAMETMQAAFARYADQIGPDAPSSAASLNAVAVLRKLCALPKTANIEATWAAARLVGIAQNDNILVDSCVSAAIVSASGATPKKKSPSPNGIILSSPAQSVPPQGFAVPDDTRVAVVRSKADAPSDHLFVNAGRIASFNIEDAAVDLYVGGTDATVAPEVVDIKVIDKTAGQALDIIPVRDPATRRPPKVAKGKAIEISHNPPTEDDSGSVNEIYDQYRPECAIFAEAKPHPAALIQSKTLAGSKPVAPTYKPMLDPEVIRSGALSDIQLESIVLAGEAHSKLLPFDPDLNAEPRLGFLVADGTGAGKTNETTGIILDNWNRGRRKAIVVGEKQRHRENVVKAMQMLGMSTENLINLGDYNRKHAVPKRNGILYLTYALLRSQNETGRFDRLKQITDWVGEDFDGVIVLDESQNMRNGLDSNKNDGGWGVATSLQGLAGIKLQNALPNARVVYCSATGATELDNLAYMVRLGLWGAGTSYAKPTDFFDDFGGAGLSGLEAITSHIKAAGQMVCRQLSLEGVRYEELIHPMSANDIELFDRYSNMLYEITSIARTCIENAVPADEKGWKPTWRQVRTANGGTYFGALYAQLSKRVIDTLIVSIKTHSLIEDIKKALARGEACVIQLQNTFEAELDRHLDSGDIDASKLQAASELIRFVESLPEVLTNKEGFAIKKNGSMVTIDMNVDAKRALIEKIQSMPGFIRPLEALLGNFGTSQVAEITGRSKRVVPVDALGNHGDANAASKLEPRTERDVRQDWRAFMNDQKQILVFSNSAGGTGMDYHASLFARNQRQRRHYVLQLGSQADQAVQGLGRSHRSNQKQPPVVSYVALDIPAEKVYLSSVVTRMASLGALSQGHRQATSNGLFTSLDSYRSSHAYSGWSSFYAKLKGGSYDDLKPEDITFLNDLETKGSYRGQSYITLEVFLRRAATLPIAVQRKAFAYLDSEIANHVMALISDGNFDTGPEFMREEVRTIDENVIYTHPFTGARVKVTKLECDPNSNISYFSQAYQTALLLRSTTDMPQTWFNMSTADVWIEVPTGLASNGWEMVHVIRPDGECVMPKFAMRGRRIEKVEDQSRAEMLWQVQVDRIKNHRAREKIMISGALPLIWKHFGKTKFGFGRRLWIANTSDGSRILGFITSEEEVEDIRIKLGNLKVGGALDFAEIKQELDAGKTIVLSNSTMITPQLVMTAVRQTYNLSDDKLKTFKANAPHLGLDLVTFNGLEYLAFPTDSAKAEQTLKNLIALYGYAYTSDQPDWSLIA
ncbi:strawberry notch-like NTP hydrolase domain-containing protein [Microvirga tunisiensis]|nr:strawberry notch family protein [Microvirga tunisiensis]